ncbi:MAG: hypothetical protein GX977_14780 [Firmicutes bacterium]|nr:hypothetical protein [Bacillota bacterium]
MIKRDLLFTLFPVKWAKEVLGFQADRWQQQVLESTERQIILNVTRQGGKSTVTAIKALHRALYYPNSLILVISPSLRQSGEFFRKVKDGFQRLSEKPSLLEDNRLSLQLNNKSRIVSLPSSEETIRGYSAVDMLLFDEFARVDDELYQAVRPMLAVSNGQIILLSTPKGKSNEFYNIWHGGEGWLKIEVTADQIPRISEDFLENEKLNMGERAFLQEYYCRFMEDEDALWSNDLINQAVSKEHEAWIL